MCGHPPPLPFWGRDIWHSFAALWNFTKGPFYRRSTSTNLPLIPYLEVLPGLLLRFFKVIALALFLFSIGLMWALQDISSSDSDSRFCVLWAPQENLRDTWFSERGCWVASASPWSELRLWEQQKSFRWLIVIKGCCNTWLGVILWVRSSCSICLTSTTKFSRSALYAMVFDSDTQLSGSCWIFLRSFQGAEHVVNPWNACILMWCHKFPQIWPSLPVELTRFESSAEEVPWQQSLCYTPNHLILTASRVKHKAQEQLGSNAAQGPHVYGLVKGETQNGLWSSVPPGLNIWALLCFWGIAGGAKVH